MTDKRIKEPCPFCGAPASEIQILRFMKDVNKIYCPYCQATFEGGYGKLEVIKKWNTRCK